MKRQAKRSTARAPKSAPVDTVPVRASVAKVSHTLEMTLAEKLREFAFHERISESAVIEFALSRFFQSARDATLGTLLRTSGAGKRRKI